MKEKLNKIRQEIDLIDCQMIKLLEERIALVKKVGQIKSSNCEISFIKADREFAMLVNLLSQSQHIPQQIIIAIWRLIISFSLQHEKKFAVNCFSANIEKAKRLIREYFSALTQINFSPSLNSKFGVQDLLVFERSDQKLYKYLYINNQYKIFTNLPDLNGDEREFFYLSNLLVAAKIMLDTITYDIAIIAVPQQLAEQITEKIFLTEIEINAEIFYICEVKKKIYNSLKKEPHISLLGGYASDFAKLILE
ncbi:MAG: chorismate mutase [Rickettsiales bacterium]